MYKLHKVDFQWFGAEAARKPPMLASANEDGTIYLGNSLRECLPKNIFIGFDSANCLLAIKNGNGQGRPVPRAGRIKMPSLTAQIARSGLELPAGFLLERDEGTGYLVGTARPPLASGQVPERGLFNIELLLKTHKHIINSSVYRLAKTTPIEDRKAIATAAFFEAAREYRNGFGNLEDYLRERVKAVLIQENRHYVAQNRLTRYSLDAAISTSRASAGSRYEITADPNCCDTPDAADSMAEEDFLDRLPSKEMLVYSMAVSGYDPFEIAQKLTITEGEVAQMAERIGKKRTQFYKSA